MSKDSELLSAKIAVAIKQARAVGLSDVERLLLGALRRLNKPK